MLTRYRNDDFFAKFDLSDSTLTREEMKDIFLRNFRKVIYLFVDFDTYLENEEEQHPITVMVAKPVPGDIVIDPLELEEDLKEFKNLMNRGNVKFSIKFILMSSTDISKSVMYEINNKKSEKSFSYVSYSVPEGF